jgi:hypothetical protein
VFEVTVERAAGGDLGEPLGGVDVVVDECAHRVVAVLLDAAFDEVDAAVVAGGVVDEDYAFCPGAAVVGCRRFAP